MDSTTSQNLMTFDEALIKVGAANRYQIIVFIYFGLQWFFANWVLQSPLYLFYAPNVDCKGNSECLKVCPKLFSDQNCKTYICSLVINYIKKYFFLQSTQKQKEMLYGESLITAFDEPLVCDKEQIANFLKGMPFVGSFIGFFIFSFVADNYGRKLAIGFAWLLAFLGCIVQGLSYNISMSAIGILLTGLGVNPAITLHYSMVNEHTCILISLFFIIIVGPFKDLQNAGIQVFYGLGEIAVVPIAYYFPNWRYLALLWFGIPIGLLTLPIFYLEESPKFIYQKDKKKAVKILNNIARKNNKEQISHHQVEACKKANNNSSKVYTALDFFRYKSLRWNFIGGLLVYFGITSIYYGISFVEDQIGLNVYINQLIIGVFETVAYALAERLILNLLRRKWMIIGFITTSLMAFSYMFLIPPEDCGTICTITIIQTILAASMKFVLCFIWSLVYVYLAELYPTVVRSLALGLISAGGTIGSTQAPFIISVSYQIGINPLITLGAIGFIAAIIQYTLKETRGEQQEDQIQEEKDLNQKQYEDYLNQNDTDDITDLNGTITDLSVDTNSITQEILQKNRNRKHKLVYTENKLQ